MSEPPDRQHYFVCPTLTPLYYTPIWKLMRPDEQLRYNQLTGLCFNELIGLFERSFQPAYQAMLRNGTVPDEIRPLLAEFIEDETRHAQAWWRLNQLIEPTWYDKSPFMLVTPSKLAMAMLRSFVKRPMFAVATTWMILVLEEHSLEITRRCICSSVPIEPQFLAAYRLHAQEEARHVQIDCRVLSHLFSVTRTPVLRLNVQLLLFAISRFLYRPVNAAAGVVRQLIREFPRLGNLKPGMMSQLANLSRCQAYRDMMFSPASSPLAVSLAKRCPAVGHIFDDI